MMHIHIPGPPASPAWRVMGVVLASVTLLMAGCEAKKDAAASQTAAKVNKGEVTVQEINLVLQQQRGLRPEQAEAASRQILERLIDQELALQKAAELKLDREPRVMQQLDAARREVLSRAYFEKIGETAAKPTPQEVANYYEANPALFKDRRIYNLQEIIIEAAPEQVAELKAQLGSAKSINDFIEYLKANDIRFAGGQAIRAAEQLPIASLGAFAAMKNGQALLSPTPSGAQVIVLAGSRSQPITLERATPAIEQFLLNARKRDLVAKDLKAIRDGATVQYAGKYAEPAASAASADHVPSVTMPSPGLAASGSLDAASVVKDGSTK